MKKSILVSTEDIAETAEFVIVKFTEVIDGALTVSLEKGIKNADGDIIRFEKLNSLTDFMIQTQNHS